MKGVFESDLFKDFTSKMLLHIKEGNSVRDDSVETILPGVLHMMDDTNKVIT
jgi:hypothetical protein